MAVTDRLNEGELRAALAALPGWSVEDGALTRTFERGDFASAMALVMRAALLAERHDHHPDITIRWSRVTFRLLSHDASALTRRDSMMASALSEAAEAR